MLNISIRAVEHRGASFQAVRAWPRSPAAWCASRAQGQSLKAGKAAAVMAERTGPAGRRRGGRFANVTRRKTADNGERTGLRGAWARGFDALPVLRVAVRHVA